MIQKLLSFFKFDNSRTLILNICTLIGGFGGMPETPAFLTNAVKNFPFLKWLLLTVLIYQGGGEQDFQLAVELTVIIFFVYNILEKYEQSKTELF